jgi:hypothetical protein
MFRIVGSADDVLRTARQSSRRSPSKKCCACRWCAAHHRGSAGRGVPVHHRHSVPGSLGHADPVRAGSFLVAHTAEEHLAIDEMDAAIAGYERIAAS